MGAVLGGDHSLRGHIKPDPRHTEDLLLRHAPRRHSQCTLARGLGCGREGPSGPQSLLPHPGAGTAGGSEGRRALGERQGIKHICTPVPGESLSFTQGPEGSGPPVTSLSAGCCWSPHNRNPYPQHAQQAVGLGLGLSLVVAHGAVPTRAEPLPPGLPSPCDQVSPPPRASQLGTPWQDPSKAPKVPSWSGLS